MANYYFNPADYAVDTSLTDIGWTERWVNRTGDSWLIKEPSAGTKVVRYTKESAATGRLGLSLDQLDSDSGRANIEMLIVGRSIDNVTTNLRLMARASGAAAAETGLCPGVSIGSNLIYTLNGYNAGSPLTVATATQVSGAHYNTWVATRVRINGNDHSFKTWFPSDPANPTADEPAGWQRTATNATVSGAGWVGLFRFDHGNHEILKVAFATGGDTAAFTSGGDTTAPTLTSPTASATGATTASGSVSTNEANGTLYYLASANATETDVTVKAGSSQAVTATGEQPVTITGLTAATPYYPHYLHRDAAGNDSAVASGAQFTTAAANTGPSFTGPNIADISGTEAVALTPVDVSAKFYDAESGLTFSAIGSWPAGVTVSGAGVISGTPTTAGTYASLQVRATDAGSLTADSNAFTITVAAPGDAENPTLTGSVTFTSITQTSYTAQWPAGSDNVAVTGYEYQIGSTAGAWTDAGNSLSAAITGRTAGATETVYVRDYDAAGLRSTPAISGSVTLESIPASGINVTEPLKNNTGTVLASQSGVRVAVLQAADLVSVYEVTGLTTNASGILSTISDAAITAGQQYHVAIKLADGSVGITGPITAS